MLCYIDLSCVVCGVLKYAHFAAESDTVKFGKRLGVSLFILMIWLHVKRHRRALVSLICLGSQLPEGNLLKVGIS